VSVTESIAGFLMDRTSRRGFLARATITATALSVSPLDLVLRPGTAYATICECVPGTECNCSDLCCDGYTQFCCTINNGVNACPQGAIPGGWWKADGSAYCAGPRYYIDCHGTCSCGCSEGLFCPGCDNLNCECALGNCGNRHVGCAEFRYGQCNQAVSCVGRIECRVVSCTPPWILYPTCTTVSQQDDATADHFAPCQDGPISYPPTYVGMAATPTGKGYWLVDSVGGVHCFGDAVNRGSLGGIPLSKPVVGMAATPTGKGYWLVASDGGVFTFGDAHFDGSTGNIALHEPMVGMSPDKPTGGYRLFAGDGGIFDFDSVFYGSTGGIRLNKPVVAMAATSTGKGYWLAASDGGVFTFGDARFFGSLGDVVLHRPIVGMAATSTAKGYWMVGSDGGVFTFGDAVFRGSLGSQLLQAEAASMAATATGKGYWIMLANGQVFPFGDAATFPPAV
jgi:hypothetical protein